MKEFKSLNGYIVKDETARSIAKGRNQAIAFDDYADMVTALNALPNTEYRVGQNIYIKTVNVPDLWVASVESIMHTFNYTTDEEMVKHLEDNTVAQVGYYKLAMLETQKVDLTDYAKTSDVDAYVRELNNALNEKSDRITETENELKTAKAKLVELEESASELEENISNTGGDLNDILRLKTFSIPMTLNAGHSGNATAYVELEGYTPLGVIEIDHDSDGYEEVRKWSIVNNRVYALIHNNYTSERTFNVSIKVLYVKNSFASSVIIS